MYKRILVPVDGSETALVGLREAIRIARHVNAKLLLLYVVDDPSSLLVERSPGAGFKKLSASLQKARAAIIEKCTRMAAEQGVESESETLLAAHDQVPALIASEARTSGCDLIVMGTHGRKGIDRFIVGLFRYRPESK